MNMSLEKTVNMISTENIVKDNSDMFEGLGLIENECELVLNPNVIPVVDPPRRIPFSLYDNLKSELDRMAKLNVIVRVEEPTEWVSSIVLVSKPNGQLRICLDPRNLNKAILRPHFSFPNIDDCKAKLSGSRFFSTLDANSGFWMVPLNENSSRLCTFNTPLGRYRFLRLPFGINAASEIFHAEMIKLFGDIEGLLIYIDDFLIFASTLELYLGGFIENLSLKNKDLRELLRKDIAWHWNDNHNREFNNLKLEITKTLVLTYFDPSKQLTLTVDASKHAVGAAILHGRNPIAYASASLTSAQTNYAQIKKELFAILFGCVRFHQYTYGIQVNVETDHKPLVALFEKPLYKIPARLQRFMLRLQCYNLNVVYKPGKYLYIADTLSRCSVKESSLVEFDSEVSLHCNFLKSHMELPFSNVLDVEREVEIDDTCQKIKFYIRNGWPKHRKLVEKEILPYFKVKDELTIFDTLILKGNQILIPYILRRKILEAVHEGHMGIQRCKSLARKTVYWPNIHSEIMNLVSNCEICLKYRNSNSKQEMIPHEIYEIPWFKVGCDIFEHNKRKYLIVVDYYTKCFEIDLLYEGFSGVHVILKLKSMFARFGIPQFFISDNGPPYNSKVFRTFCDDWGIVHKISSPYLPRSNGLAERSIQTVKKMLNKYKESGSDPYIALLHYRTTPKSNMPSPAELLMFRNLRTKLPSVSKNFQSKLIDKEQYKEQLNFRTMKSAEYFNKNTKNRRSVKPGDKIMFKKNNNSFWFHGQVSENCPEPRSHVARDEGVEYRRSDQHILKIPDPIHNKC